jgi:hypothetical protein
MKLYVLMILIVSTVGNCFIAHLIKEFNVNQPLAIIFTHHQKKVLTYVYPNVYWHHPIAKEVSKWKQQMKKEI